MSKSTVVESAQDQPQLIHGLRGLCNFLDISMKTACFLTKKLPHYRAGRNKIYFKQDEILSYMAVNQSKN